MVIHPSINPETTTHIPPEPAREEVFQEKDRASFTNPEKKALFGVAKLDDLIGSIGTLLKDIQLSQFSARQLDELTLLIAERWVVFFRDQDSTTEGQVKPFTQYGTLDKHLAQKGKDFIIIRGSTQDHCE